MKQFGSAWTAELRRLLDGWKGQLSFEEIDGSEVKKL